MTRSRQALDRSYQEMESLYNIGQLVNSTLDLDEVLQLIAENTTRLFGAKACFLRLFDRSGKKLSIGASYGLSQAYINKGPVETEKSPVDSEVLKGMTIQVLEVSEDARFQYREEARAEGLRSMLSCPIRVKNRILGVIRVYTGEPHVFSEQEQRLLLNLANLGALALQNAHAFGELQALDKEREWFARTTHHQLRSPLAAAQGAIEALPFAGPLNEAQADLLARARRRIQDSFDTVRDLLDSATAQRFQDTDSLEPVRLAESLRRALDIAREQARSKGLSFEEEPDGEDCLLQAERRRPGKDLFQPADQRGELHLFRQDRLRHAPRGRLGRGVGGRHGDGHRARGTGPDLQRLLPDRGRQGYRGGGNGAGSLHRCAAGETDRGNHHGGERTRKGLEIPGPPAHGDSAERVTGPAAMGTSSTKGGRRWPSR